VLDCIFAQRLSYCSSCLLKFLMRSRLLGKRALREFFLNDIRQFVFYEIFYDLSLVVHDAVDTEVQVGALELEEFPQKLLKLL